jgi:hypothetical protein
MPALLAGIVNDDAPDADTVDDAEEAAVGAAKGAEGFAAQKVDRGEAADEQKRNGDVPLGEGGPEIFDDEGAVKTGEGAWVGEPEGPVGAGDFEVLEARYQDVAFEGRVDEHVQGQQQRAPQQQARAPGLGADAELGHPVGAEVLQGDDVATPAADEAPEDEGGEEGDAEEDESGVDLAEFEGVHALAGLDGGDGHPDVEPLKQMDGHQQIDDGEDDGAAWRVAALFRLGGREHGERQAGAAGGVLSGRVGRGHRQKDR